LLYGPIVLAADLGTAGLDEARRYGPMAPDASLADRPTAPALVAESPSAVLARVKPSGAPLTFRTERLGRPDDVELRPFFRLTDRRYAVYFPVLTEAGWQDRARRASGTAEMDEALEARTVDAVQPGVEVDEAAHALRKSRSDSGWFEGRRYRGARGGGEFSYLLKVPASGAAALRVTYWGGESRRHRFAVLVEDQVVAKQGLFDDRPGEVLPVEYAIPDSLTSGRDRIRVGFRPVPGGSTGALFDVRVVRPAP
jgi:hypothetical protein